MEQIYWVGIKETEIRTCKHLFSGSITFIGTGKNGNISYSSSNNYIINYNEDSIELDNFMKKQLNKVIDQIPEVSFLCYTPLYIYSLKDSRINKHIICSNNEETLQLLRNKMNTRLWLNQFIPVLPTTILSGNECNYSYLCSLFPNEISFTIQGCTGAGGVDTYIMTVTNFTDIKNRLCRNNIYLVSPYKAKSYSTNIHILFTDDDYYITPGSIQIVEKQNGRMIYRGSDFIEYQNISFSILTKIQKITNIIAKKIQSLSYKGILGIDYLVSDEEVYFLEINPRFQSSTSIINLALNENSLPSIQELVLNAFKKENCIISNSFKNLKVNYSNYIIDYENNHYDYSTYLQNIKNSKEIYNIELDGYYDRIKCEYGASIFNIIFPKNIISLNHNGNFNIYDNIKPFQTKNINLNSNADCIWLKFSMMNQGVCFSKNVEKQFPYFQKGVYSSLDIYISNKFIINTPIENCFNSLSPFNISYSENKQLALYYGCEFVTYVNIHEKNHYCEQYTKNGVNFQHISFIATDRLRIHHSSNCLFQTLKQGCKFCDVPGDSLKYNENDITEVIDWHIKNSKFRHILIGGASGNYPEEHIRIMKIIKYIRTKTNKPIYLMTLPPMDTKILDEYYMAGVNDVAFNIEIFDRNLAAKVMPGKGKIPINTYQKSLLYSVKLWGNTGNVKSILIYGLESDETFLKCVEWLSSNGIQPIISPFRPLKGTALANTVPTSTEKLIQIYYKASDICKKYNIKLGPDCIYCQNNTISFDSDVISPYDMKN